MKSAPRLPHALLVAVLTSAACGVIHAQTDPFVGTWTPLMESNDNIKNLETDGIAQSTGESLAVSQADPTHYSAGLSGTLGTATIPDLLRTGNRIQKATRPTDMGGWNMLDFIMLSDGTNRTFAMIGQEKDDATDISLTVSSWSSHTGSITADDFVGTWNSESYCDTNLLNAADGFEYQTSTATIQRIDADHIQVLIGGTTLALRVSGNEAFLESPPVVSGAARCHSFRIRTDGQKMSFHLVASELNDWTDVSATLGLGIRQAAPTLTLIDYHYPRQQGASWLYQGNDGGGNAGKLRVAVASTDWNVNLYTGRSPVQSYNRSVLRLKYESGTYSGGDFSIDSIYDNWYEYPGLAAPLTFYGADDNPGVEEYRVDRGCGFPLSVSVGQTYSPAADFYYNGAFQGVLTCSMQVLDVLPVTVAAGTFSDCIHLRFSRLLGGSPIESSDEWWARGTGMVKRQGISGEDAASRWELLSSTSPVLSPTLKSVTRAAQSYALAVTTSGAWTAAETLDWISLSPDSGSGNGTVTVTLTENATGAARQGLIVIAGTAHWVDQATGAVTLDSALDSPGMVWTTGGNVAWFAQTTTTHDGVDAARSGAIAHSQESWMQSALTGPATLTFWWKVSSEEKFDFLEFYLDGVLQSGRISGTVDWQMKTYSITAGAHAVKWRYMKDGSVSSGTDAGWVDEVVFVPTPSPEITVEQPSGTDLTDGSASVALGSAELGTGVAKTFTIRNLGTANLTGLAVSRDGTNASDFTVGALGATTLAAGASTTFTITFAPGATGSKTAAIRIASNDANENPFDINLTGTGIPLPYTYTTANGSITITGYTGPGGDVVIPSTINCLPVTGIGDEAFADCSGLTSVMIRATVTGIGNGAFTSCDSLTSIAVDAANPNFSSEDGVLFDKLKATLIQYPGGKGGAYLIPNSVTSIGGSAFYECTRLAGVTIPASVTSIGDLAFAESVGLMSITVDAENPDFSSADGVLFDKLKATLIQYPGGKVGTYLIPSSVTRIGGYAFDSCRLTGVTLPDELTSIGDSAFDDCHGLSSVTIPAKVTSIGYGAFTDCTGLLSIEVAAANLNYRSAGGVLFDKVMSVLVQCPAGKSGSYPIPASVTRIGDNAFSKCIWLTGVTIPDGVTSLGDGALDMCRKLTSVTLPATVTSIGDWAFSGCIALTRVTFIGDAPLLGTHVFDAVASGFTVYYFNGNTGFTSPIWNGYPAVGLPIALEQPAGICLAAGGTRDFGTLAVGNTASRVVTIRNTSELALTGLTVSKDGANSGDFTVGPLGATTLAPGATTTFSITFAPSATAPRSAALHIASSTPSETPFDIGLTGNGPFDYREVNGTIIITGYTGPGGAVVIPDTINGLPVTDIDEWAFEGCSGLMSVTIPASVTSIGEGAFEECSGLAMITVDAANPNYSSDEGMLFDKLKTLLIQYPAGKGGAYVVHSGVTSIGDGAFAYCTSLTSVTIPAGVTSIGDGAFAYCTSLATITVDIPNSSYSSEDGVLFNNTKTMLIQYPGGKVGNYTIPAGVTNIGDGAFAFCSSPTSITIPNSVTSIGNLVFNECTSLASITIPNSVTSIGYLVFWNCTSLASITISNSVTSIEFGAFAFCTSLTSVTIPNSVTSIGGSAFNECTSLASVTIPASVTSIGDGAFEKCNELATITVDAANPNYSSDEGVLFDKLKTLLIQYPEGKGGAYVVPSGVTSIGDGAFAFCASLTSVTIPNSVTSIGGSAFYECTSLASVTIPASVASIGDWAFEACISLTGIYFQGNTPSLGVGVFDNDESATVYYLPWTTGWGSTFGGRPTALGYAPVPYTYRTSHSSVTITGYTGPGGDVVIPDTINGLPVTGIGEWAFSGCSGLMSITIPASVSSIGYGAFEECNGLASIVVAAANQNYSSAAGVLFNKSKSLLIQYPGGKGGAYVIPPSVTSIGNGAFQSCDSLTSVTIPGSVTSIGGWAFHDSWGLTSVSIPASVTSIGQSAFADLRGALAITVDAANPNYSTVNGVLFNKARTTLIQYPGGKAGSYTIPAGVTSIGDEAFSECRRLTVVSIAASVTSIGNSAFQSCEGLTDVTIPASVTSIGPAPFEACISLPSISVDAANPNYSSTDGVLFDKAQTTLIQYPGAKDGSYTIPSVTSIGPDAFSGCGGLTSVTIPASVTIIGDGAFDDCTSLISLSVDAANPNYSSANGVLFDKLKTSLIQYPAASGGTCSVPASVTSIGDAAFSYCSGLTAITVDAANPNYSSAAGVLFDKLKTLLIRYPAGKGGTYTIPASVTSVAEDAFYQCSGLTSVTIPASVTLGIWDAPFEACSGWTSITVDAANPNFSSVDGVLFNKLQTLLIQYPPGKLGAYTIPASVTRIGDGAFYQCGGVTSATIPASVTSIGEGAFFECGGLTRASFLGDAPAMSWAVFGSTASGFTVYYLNGATGFTSPTWMGYPTVNMGDSSPAAIWLVSNGFPSSSNLQDDPNHDGVNLLLAYALNLDPNQDLSASLPQPVLAGNQLGLTFYAGNDDVAYAVESSTDLQTWNTTGVTVSAPDANNFRTATVPTTDPRRFLRLVVAPLAVLTDDQQIRALYAEMLNRVTAHDEAAFLALFAPDYLHQGEDLADMFDEPEFLDTVESFAFNLTDITITGNQAKVSGSATVTFNNGEPPVTWTEPDTTGDSEGLGWLRKTPAGWRIAGDQVRARMLLTTTHPPNPGNDHYFLRFHTVSSLSITGISVSGPAIATTELQPDPGWGGFTGFAGHFTSAQCPPVGSVYTFVVRFADGSQETYQDSIKAWVGPCPAVAVTPGAGTATIQWTDVSVGVPNAASYGVRVYGADESDSIWRGSEELPLTQASIAFNADGAATGTLIGGKTYTAVVTIFDAFGNMAFQSCSFTMPPEGFALIPAGPFQMGDQSSPLVGWPSELPIHTVQVSTFYMGKHEVTKEEWDAVRTWGLANGYADLPAGSGKAADHPVHSINWFAMVKWCNARSQKEGLTPCYTVSGATYKTGDSAPVCNWSANGYRLPTEAEWEKAARGGLSGQNFPWGNTINHSFANYNNGSYSYESPQNQGFHPTYSDGTYPYSSPVGSFAPNGYGLYDMAGNMWELCWDWSDAYAAGSQTDPRGATSGTYRVVRGGGWGDGANGCRVAFRFYGFPADGYYGFGFRLALSSVP